MENVFVNGELRVNSTQKEHPNQKKVDKYIYILIALFFGDFGIHKFYAGRIKTGILYLLFFWTFIPWLFSIFDIIKACGKIKDTENKIWL
jgi:TM2 domain-containing membrane protein YozV